jgi:hypothetical protein
MDEHGFEAMGGSDVLIGYSSLPRLIYLLPAALGYTSTHLARILSSATSTATIGISDHNSRFDSSIDVVLNIQPDRAFNIARHAINVVGPRSPTSLSSVHSGFIEVSPHSSWLCS